MKTKLLKRLRKETKDSFSVSIKNGFYFIHDTHVSRGNDIMISHNKKDLLRNLDEVEEELRIHQREYILERILEMRVYREMRRRKLNIQKNKYENI